MINEDITVRDYSGNEYSHHEFSALIKEYAENNYEFYIGTDSQIIENYVNIVTVICPRLTVSETGRSSRIYYIKEKLNKDDCPNLRARMLLEAYRSIEMAMFIDPFVKTKISIHLDIGSGQKSKTRLYEKELQYLVSSQGYECKIKPDSWAAAGVADRLSKN